VLKATFNIKRAMYVCLCTGVTDQEIRKTVAEGAASVEEVAYCTGAGTRCGTCISAIAAIVHEGEAPCRRSSLPVLASNAA
jgi:bacterioferritin-associated ferredoxin